MSTDHSTAKPVRDVEPHWTARAAAIVVPRRRHDLDVHVLEDEAIVCDPRLGSTHRLNSTALLVWRMCDGRLTTRQLAAALSRTYDVDFETALDDVEQTILSLAERNLVGGTAGS